MRLSLPSRIVQILDEAKTITQTAEEEFCLPILKPASRRWLDVVLIIETSPSFGIWQQTIKEFKNLLLLQGAFRDVKCWYASVDEYGKLDFRSQQGTRRSPKELIIPSGDRLILILSDCVSSAWYNNVWHKWINFFGQHHPITILQMLPPSFWRRTALGQMDSVWLSSKTPGALNHKWNQESATPWEEETPEGFPIPVVTLDSYALEVWAKGIAGASPTNLAGVYLQTLNLNSSERAQTSSSPEQLFEQFMDTASPTARRLAALLSAVPVQLPIVRLIQRSLLATNSNAVHVAEIFFSGILRCKEDHRNPEKRFYDFEEGLRAKFNDTLSKQEIVSVIDRISAYIARRAGVSIRDFRAMLAVPSEQLESPLADEISEFARISKQVLQGMGKEYAAFANALDQGEIYLADLGIALKNFSYQVGTFEFGETFEFDIVTIARKEQRIHRPSLEEINLIEQQNARTFAISGRYQSYEELREKEKQGEDYRIDYHQGNSDVAIIAPHGGNIEPGVTEISFAIAGEDHSFYSFEGLKEGNNHILSIPSKQFDEPRALEIVSQANRVIAIHGFFGEEESVYLVGLDEQLRKKIKQNLEEQKFRTIEYDDSTFEGSNPDNICNRGKTGKGVQIGIPWGLRKQVFDSLKRGNNNEPTLYDRFIQAIRDAISTQNIINDDRLEASGWQYQTYRKEVSYFNDDSLLKTQESDTSQLTTEKLDFNQGLILPDMVSIPGGTFIMGTENEEIERLTKKFERDWFQSESPQHQVTVQPFYMSKYPITQRQWKAIALRTDLKVKEDLNPEPSDFKENPKSFSFPSTRGNLDLPYYGENPTYLDRPVEQVNWYQAKEFCDRLSQLTGKEYRLPTEAEWEYACRSVISEQSSVESEELTIEEWNEKYNQPFYFGETITSDLANYYGESTYADEPKGVDRLETTPVGMFPPNAFGLYDLHGNVWEWCEDDWHDNYDGAPTHGSAWLDQQERTAKLLRGGSFDDFPNICRSAFRYNPYARGNILHYIGFRVVCVLPRTS